MGFFKKLGKGILGAGIGKSITKIPGVGKLGESLLGYRQERKAETAAEEQANIGRELYRSTAGLRTGTTNLLEAILRGEDPTALGTFAPYRTGIEDAYGMARENILSSSGGRGGQLYESLSNLDISKAQDIGMMNANLRQALLGPALGLGFATPGLALQGLNQGGRLSYDLAGFQQQRLKDLFTGFGNLFGSSGFGMGGVA